MPGRIGMSAPTARGPLDEADVVGRPEDHLGDRELGAGVVLGHQHARRPCSRSAASTWPSGKAATPMRKSPRSRTSATSSLA